MLVMGAFAAALAVGVPSFGDALIAAAFWLHVMGPSEAVLLIVACGVTICAINQVILRDKLDTSRLVPFLAGGVLGGFAGLSGVLPTIWSGLRAWPKARQRGTYQPYVLTMHGLALVSSPSPVSSTSKWASGICGAYRRCSWAPGSGSSSTDT